MILDWMAVRLGALGGYNKWVLGPRNLHRNVLVVSLFNQINEEIPE